MTAFDAASKAEILFEHPLNERIRTLMRLEDLFARAHYFADRDGAPEHHAALLSLFEITDVASRADLKTDLLQELERQKQVLGPLRSNPDIDQQTLSALLATMEQVNASLLAQAGKVGMHLRENSRSSRHTAYRGVFQLMLTTTKVAQLLRLTLDQNPPYVPEISANKYALNIRFIGVSGMDRGSVYHHDVHFELIFCNL
jgi:cell division FtsZ-interacting protein ZapD